MNIESYETTIEVDRIWEITLSLFVDALNEQSRQLKSPYSEPALFIFYENFISYPIDDLKDGESENRIDFYEAVSLMSWALYRKWVRKVIDEKFQLDCFREISKDGVVKLFMDNLDCDEGRLLFKKFSAAGWTSLPESTCYDFPNKNNK